MTESQQLAIVLRQQGAILKDIADRTGISMTSLSRLFKKQDLIISHRHPCFSKEWMDAHSHLTKRDKAKLAGVDIGTIAYWSRSLAGKTARIKTNDTLAQLLPDETWDNYEWLNDHYNTQQLGIPTIARKIGVSNSRIVGSLERFGIKRRSLKEAMNNLAKRPTKEWIQQHYIDLGWSIDKCAAKAQCGWAAMYKTIIHYGFQDRSAKEQFSGVMNPFYGRRHTDEAKAVCTESGAFHGTKYWTSGDISEKVKQITEKAKLIWSDPIRREEQSKRITKLCQIGLCNAKKHVYKRANGEFIYPASSWELAIAELLDDLEIVQSWGYEELAIPYMFNGTLHNFIVDFRVTWTDGLTTYIECKNQHLLEQEKEQSKIAAATQYLSQHKSNFILVSSMQDIAHCKARSRIDPGWQVGNRYNIPSSIIKNTPSIILEILKHDITLQLVDNWKPMTYSDTELQLDLTRLKSENLNLYTRNNEIVATPGGPMAGRIITTHFHEHFYKVRSNDRLTLIDAMSDPWVIYRGLDQSISEGDGLTLERLLREIWFLFPGAYSRTSHFPTGLARHIIRKLLPDPKGKLFFDPCCGWGSRLLAAHVDGMRYSGCELSDLTYSGLQQLSDYIGCDSDLHNIDCLAHDWPDADIVLTSPPFYDIEEYIGGDQLHRLEHREDWVSQFVEPFLGKLGNMVGAFYLDQKTLDDFTSIRKPTAVIPVKSRRHPRQKVGYEYFAVYNA